MRNQTFVLKLGLCNQPLNQPLPMPVNMTVSQIISVKLNPANEEQVLVRCQLMSLLTSPPAIPQPAVEPCLAHVVPDGVDYPASSVVKELGPFCVALSCSGPGAVVIS
jgi:hypothetical protein